MLSNPSQYSPQGLMPQFPGLQAAGWPQVNPGLFAQPGTNSGNLSFGQESGQAGQNQQYQHPFGFGGQANSFQQNPFAQNQFLQSPFAMNPHLQSQLLQNSIGHNPAQNIITALGQLSQQLAVQTAMTQQIGNALQQLAQQLAVQSPQGYPGGQGTGQTFSALGQPFGFGGPFSGTPSGSQYFGQNPFANAQGGYGGFNPQAQVWGANRSQTIQ